MSKQEMYAWASLASTLAILGIYVLMVGGLPEGFENYASAMMDMFIKIIVMAFLVELVLGLSKHTKAGRIDKDERDVMIEGKGFRNAYYFVMAAMSLLAAHLFIGNLLGEEITEHLFILKPAVIFPALLLVFLLTGLIKSATQLYYYRQGL